MQFMVLRRLVRLGGVDRGVDPPYRQKKKKKTCGYCSCIYTLSCSLSCPSFIERLLELAELSFCFWRTDMANFVDFTISNGAP